MKKPRGPLYILFPTLALALMSIADAQSGDDPHHPSCRSVRCKKIASFLRLHVCAPFSSGNFPGPKDDGCEVRPFKKLSPDVEVLADYRVEWANEQPVWKQLVQPPSGMREILVRELQGIGLPQHYSGKIFFRIWKSRSSGWLLAEAYYFRWATDYSVRSQVIAIIGQDAQVTLLRKLPPMKADIDGKNLEYWTPVQLVDVDGDGQIDVVLLGDEYENHWYEVFSLEQGTWKMIFSGLGYWL